MTDQELFEVRKALRSAMTDRATFALSKWSAGIDVPHLSPEEASRVVTVLENAPRLLLEVERARALLKAIEWSGGSSDRCPGCDGMKPLGRKEPGEEPASVPAMGIGHRPDCELAALLGGVTR